MASSERFLNFYLEPQKFALFYLFSAFGGAAILGVKWVNLRVQNRTSKIALMTPFIYPLGSQNNLKVDN